MSEKLVEIIYSGLERGFSLDSDTLHFLRSSCGITNEEGLKEFLKDSSLNDGTVYELAIYPDTNFRLEVEQHLPPGGIPEPEITAISEKIISMEPDIFIMAAGEKLQIESTDKKSCILSFIKRLNLEIDLTYLGEKETADSESLYYSIRALLRRRKFFPAGDRGDFMNRLIRLNSAIKTDNEEIIEIAEQVISLLSGREERVFDALEVKKYYYESVISQNEEFAMLLKTWGMEYLMMRKIQPPPVSFDEAVKMIRAIDRITSTVYGLIIPPSDIAIQITINGSGSIPDISG
ncbi:MAG TPA: hypothetical protein PK358_08230 [Spirochaetota bacterium]|nr:hypothetical protein [Spirochaetota bacterium]HPJ34807.1 hypothetical protein [Spirochaetota bacterium]